jgi:hypothetical protein
MAHLNCEPLVTVACGFRKQKAIFAAFLNMAATHNDVKTKMAFSLI